VSASKKVRVRASFDFEDELARVLRRAELLRGALDGAVEMREVTVVRKVMTWTVNAKQKSYVRRIAPAGWKPRKAAR
jgi:hypothetical protein